MRKIRFENGEIYHIFNRGVDKRDIFIERDDTARMYESLDLFNTEVPIGEIRNLSKLEKAERHSCNELVDIFGYCLNPNHIHLLLRQKIDGGISRFMHRIGSGYTRYFNEKYDRSGSLFQGQFKAEHIGDGDHLTYVTTYVNRNDEVHGIDHSNPVTGGFRGWEEYACGAGGLCTSKRQVLSKYPSVKAFVRESDSLLGEIRKNKQLKKERKNLYW